MSSERSDRKCFARPPRFGRRMVLMLCGVTVMGIALSLLRMIDLGTDPCSCFTQGLTNYIPLSFGTCQLLCHLVTFLFVIRYDISKIGYGTIGNMVLVGYVSDLSKWIWSLLLPAGFFDGIAVRLAVLVPTIVVFVLGAAVYMCSGLGSSPYDALPFIISDHVEKPPFRILRMMWDIAFMTGGWILGGDVGIVTVLVAFFLGPVITWMQKKMEVLIA